jgi:hypothetical protein
MKNSSSSRSSLVSDPDEPPCSEPKLRFDVVSNSESEDEFEDRFEVVELPDASEEGEADKELEWVVFSYPAKRRFRR